VKKPPGQRPRHGKTGIRTAIIRPLKGKTLLLTTIDPHQSPTPLVRRSVPKISSSRIGRYWHFCRACRPAAGGRLGRNSARVRVSTYVLHLCGRKVRGRTNEASVGRALRVRLLRLHVLRLLAVVDR